MEKAKQLPSDKTIFCLLDSDPTAKLEKEINKTLKKFQDMQRITEGKCRKVTAAALNGTQFWGLPKVRKEVILLRPIVSLPGTPKYRLVKELWRCLKLLTGGSNNSLANAQQVLGKL